MSAVFAVVVILIGIFNLIAPDAAWHLSLGWQFKDAEPSDAALVMTRIGGGAAVLIGLWILFSY